VRTLIVDDEPAALQRLDLMLAELDAEVVGRAANGIEALELVEQRRPDVLILDIEMPEVDGFDVVRALSDPKPAVIFQTAYDEYALKAFEHEAVDYVVKPVTLERLGKSLERASRRIAAAAPGALGPELLERLRSAVTGPARARRPRLLVRDGSGRRLLPFREILRFLVEDGMVYASVGARTYLVDYTLAEIEARTTDDFVRVNRSDLVNLDHVGRVDPHGDGTAALTLSDGTTVHVSRRRATEVMRALEE
jgi:DNA-binding LytR/AlgR family response regulator